MRQLAPNFQVKLQDALDQLRREPALLAYVRSLTGVEGAPGAWAVAQEPELRAAGPTGVAGDWGAAGSAGAPGGWGAPGPAAVQSGWGPDRPALRRQELPRPGCVPPIDLSRLRVGMHAV